MQKMIPFLLIFFLFFLPIQARKDKPVKVSTTFFVMMDKQADAIITPVMLKQEGVKKYKIDLEKQTVAITFMSDKNTVSNLLQVFRSLGYRAAAKETSCFGSKEGCLNAMHPVNTMK